MKKRNLTKALQICCFFAAAVLIYALSINSFILEAYSTSITEKPTQTYDCILVLGCGVKDDGTPSDMLMDRILTGVELYEQGVAPVIIMSGDHGKENYDEVNTMKNHAIKLGVPAEKIFLDHAGFSTYESMYRAREIFQAKKIVIVTQQYHLYRAVYIARQLGMDAYGVAADYRSYSGQTYRDIREILARVKDVGTCILLPEPTYLGEVIPISGDGNLTNDEHSDFT